ELADSAAALGCAEVVRLGFVDSGWRTEAPPDAFSRMDLDTAAAPLVEVLRREGADALTSYDAAGGYGHPDHLQVHRVGRRAAELAGTPLVLEATIDRDLIRPLVRVAAAVPRLLPSVRAAEYATAYTPRRELTHRVDVRAYVDTKRAALRAHTSQAGGDEGLRTAALLLMLPRWLWRRLLGREWFVEVGRTPGPLLDDIFTTLET
ncbi:MAG: LmbE family protein, partial [Friedmanniella sp.]|nr:LmbE family protein [Friedmanniella sp.]